MNIFKNIFIGLTALLLLLAPIFAKAQKALTDQLDLEISCLDVELPITFSWVNFDEPDKDLPQVAEQKVQKIIIDFYLGANGGDSTDISKAKDYYFNTLRTPLGDKQLYIVILKTPLSYAHCKLFLYDTASDKVSGKTVDYNIWSMYSIDENTMKRSDVYKDMHLNSDDIIFKKKSNLLLKRVKHNNSSNTLEEITYHPNGLSLDSVSFKVLNPDNLN